MKISDLKLQSAPTRKRVGRGISAGQGKTAGRGTKGQNSRTGGGVRPGFEGGQNPLAKRLPKKRGFASLSRVEYQLINLSDLGQLTGKVDSASLLKVGLIGSVNRPVKLLGDGELAKKLEVKVQAASRSAKSAVEKAGGTVELVPLPKRKAKATK